MRLLFGGFAVAFLTAIAAAQAPPKARPAKSAAAGPARKPTGTLAQVMRGIYFPNANLIFDVQQNDPGVAEEEERRADRRPTPTPAPTRAGRSSRTPRWR